MKRAILVCATIALLVLSQFAFAQDYQDWKFTHPKPQANALTKHQMIDANTWIAVGGNGAYMKTTNAGVDWYFNYKAGLIANTALTVGQAYDEWFFDANTGFVAGDRGYIGKTTNGGRSFDSLAYGLVPSAQRCQSIWFSPDHLTGYVAAGSGSGFAGTIVKTTDGGATWTNIYTSTATSVLRLTGTDARTVYAVTADGAVNKTTNGGTNWVVSGGAVPPFMYGISFLDSLTGFIVGSLGGMNKTTDAGASWTALTSPQTDWAFNQVKIVSANEIYAVGAPDYLYKSTNLGATWTALPIMPVSGPSDTFIWESLDIQGSVFTLVGDFGIVGKSVDKGLTWTSNNFLLTTQLMFDIQKVPGTKNLIAVGRQWSAGTKSILYSPDMGDHWSPIDIGIQTDLNAISMVNSQVGYACGTNSVVIKTTNGGLNWAAVTPPSATSYTLYSMEFVNVDTGWVFVNYIVPGGGGIFKTTNGGASWTQQGSNITAPIMSADMVDANNGYLTLNPSGTPIYKTTDGGTNWTSVATPLTGNIYDVSAVDANTLYIGSTFGTSRIAKSTNGGTTWTPITLPAAIDVHSVDFRDANNGYVCGNLTSAVCRTTDGGTTWSIQNVHMPTLVKVYAGTGDTAFVLGTYATILRYIAPPPPRLIVPTISAIARNVRVPNAGDTLVVTARIVDSTGVGITADSLWYSLNGGGALKVAMPRVSGTNLDGTYRGVIPGSANANGNRVEYQVWANGGGGTSTTAIAAANSYFAGISPISPSGVAAQDSLLVSRYKGYYARVTGTINGPNFQATNLSEYFQDALGGLNLFKTGSLTAVRNLGDSVIVLGKLDQFRGVREIVPDTVAVDIQTVATGRSIPVINLTVAQYTANPELYESRVIRFSGLNRRYATPPWPPAATQATIVMYQANQADTVVMFINAGTNIPGTTEPSYPVDMICLGSQFAASGAATQGGYEVLPRYATDFSNQATGWIALTSGTTNYLYSVKAVSQNVAWAAGAAGTVLRTVDHGATWSSVGGGAIGTADIYNIDAVDASTALVTTSPAATFIYRTTNGGTTWTQVYTDAGTGAFIDAIHMFNATNGVAYGDPVGGKWVLIYTSNGGSTWVRDTVNAPVQVGGEAGTQNGLCAVGSTNLWFNSGVGGRIYKTTNGGTLWTSGVAPFTATSNVWFNNAQYGVATGSTASGVARSTDGGATWTNVTVAGTGFLIACGGSAPFDFWYARGTTIYRSTDRGATFTSAYTGTGSYVGLSFVTTGSNTSGWAVTSTGGIAGFLGTVTDVQEDHKGTLPTTFALQQNYPNPFNPTTTLRYALPQAAHVSLTIYNVLGQRVVALKDEVQSAGMYNIVWDGRNESGSTVATGMYLYRLEATPTDGSQTYTSVKKMLMVK